MIGQQLMVRMDGTSPDAALLARIRNGEVGGVILFSDNIVSPSQVHTLTAELQAAASGGRNPPLLISTDQEGGQVKRLAWAPPDLSPPQMTAQGSATSGSEGERTGAALRAVGINVDLAPVVDVAHSTSSFIWQQNRSFGMNAAAVINNAIPFAEGLQFANVAPTAKHFPGLGGAITDTDYAQQAITIGPADLEPYQALIASHIPLIMISIGVYPSYDPSAPAALSHAIITGLLRNQLHYQGVVITDDLERPTGQSTAQAAIRAAAAGANIILISTTENGGALAYSAMLSGTRNGTIPPAAVQDSYNRVLALKHNYAGQ